MTQTGDPLHNALAERMNNTVKNSWLFNNGELDFITAGGSIDNAIRMYNTARPHQALGMKTPYEMMTGHSNNPLLGFQIQKNEEDEDIHDDISEEIGTFAPPRNGGATANADAHL